MASTFDRTGFYSWRLGMAPMAIESLKRTAFRGKRVSHGTWLAVGWVPGLGVLCLAELIREYMGERATKLALKGLG